jgi:hypothetical protein
MAEPDEAASGEIIVVTFIFLSFLAPDLLRFTFT